MKPSASVILLLSHDEALVLFEWLSRTDKKGAIPIEHEAEQKVLWEIEGQLEQVIVAPLAPDYGARVAAARDRVKTSA
jgi:hypothetical protein